MGGQWMAAVAFSALGKPFDTLIGNKERSIDLLASIIGSGFIVPGPVLGVSFGHYAPLVMPALVVITYEFGIALRYTIGRIDIVAHRPGLVEQIKSFASMVLPFAYIISVAHHLHQFGGFGVGLTVFDTPYYTKVPATAVFLLILNVGCHWTLPKAPTGLRWCSRSSANERAAVAGHQSGQDLQAG